MMKWIYGNIKYPEVCAQNGVEGRVTAKFTITKLGEVKNIHILRSPHPDLDAEVIRVLKMMPNFSPAMQNQQLVPVFMYWPVIFQLK
jgi:protein TonB